MKTETLGKNDQGSVLEKFIAEQDAVSVPVIVEQIKACADIKKLNSHWGSEPEIIQAQKNRLDEIDTILATIDDIMVLVEAYINGYYWRTEHGSRIYIRMRQLYANISDIDELFIFRERLRRSKLFYITENNYSLYDLVDNRVVELVNQDERKTSFDFLVTIWRNVIPTHAACIAIEKLMPAALLFEADIKKLVKHCEIGYELSVWSGWNHLDHDAYRALAGRRNQLIEESLPKIIDIQKLKWYAHITGSDSVRANIDKRLSEIVSKQLASMTDFKKIVEYRKSIDWNNHKWPATATVFNNRIDELLPGRLKKITDAEEVIPLINLLMFRHAKYKDSPIIKRFATLIPNYFKKHNNLKKAWEWYCGYRWYLGKETKTLATVITNFIANQKKPERLTIFLNKGYVPDDEKKFIDLAKNRFVVLVTQMKKSNSWFESCTINKTFFGNEKLFLQKAKEFVGK